jgi:RHS repeat-associated protein
MIRVYEGAVAQNLFTDYVFDTLGNLRRTMQGEQNRYFMYDSLGRVLFAKQPEQDTNAGLVATDPITNNSAWSVKYTFDDNGNITTTTDARNISITGSYDRLNRIIGRDYSDSTPDVSFFYDGAGLGSVPAFSKGKTTKIASSISETRNTSFDSMGRLLTSEQRTTAQQLAGTQTPYTFNYAYNLSGGLVEEIYPSSRVVRNTLNPDGELSQIQSKKNANNGFVTYADSFEYHSSGAVTNMQLGNGHWETAEYDPQRLQVTKIGLGVTSADQNLFRLEFQYNSDGRSDNNGAMRLQRIIVPSAGSNPAFTATQSYFYDSLNRISSAVETVLGNQTWKQSFSYDRYGNRRFDPAGTTTLGSCQQAVCNPAISTANNRLAAGQNYVYDPAGSVTRDAGGQRFSYDAEDHQKEYFSAGNQTNSPDATYYYDGEGRRVKKIVGAETTIFVYDASGQLAAEYSTSVVPAQQAKVSYPTSDHLGSPRVITDQYGRVSSRKDFAAFGDEIVSPQRIGGPNGNGYDPPNVRQDYTGYQKDGESGLEFAQARYYNAAHGRFTSVDPMTASATIRNPQTLNRYSYVTNNPYKFVDPLGMALVDIGVVQTTDPYLARYLENDSVRKLQNSAQQSQSRTQTQTQTQTQVEVPKELKDLAALNPRDVTSNTTGEYVGIMTLTDAEVEARVDLISLAYNIGFAEGVREVQRENGENVDVNSVQSTDGSQSGTSSQTTTGGSLSAGTNSISGTVSSSESNTQSNSRTGSMTTTATVASGVTAAAADSARLAAARQSIINSESAVVRDVSNFRTGTVKMRVDPTKAVDGFIKHGLLLGRINGRLSYDRLRILQ